MTHLHRLLAITLVAGLCASCAVNPVTGKRNLALMSEKDEIALGAKNDPQIREEYGAYNDLSLQAYVTRVGQKLAAASHRPGLTYHFTVLDSPDVNAFALPGGYVYITRGIMAYLNSEAELAAVLGHEIGHVTARHGVRQYSAAQAANIGFALGSLFVPGLQNAGAQSLFNVLGGALLSGYGREHELESDRLGAEYLARTGYDPDAMIKVIGVLKDQEVFASQQAQAEGRKPRNYHGVFDTHPSADKRLQEVVAEAKKFQTGSGQMAREDYLQHIDKLTFGDSEQQGIPRGHRFYHKELNFALSFPENWKLQNQPEVISAVSPGGDGLMQVRLLPLGTPIAASEFLQQRLKIRNVSQGQSLNISGVKEAYTGVAQLKTPFGDAPTRVTVAYFNNRAFVFFGAAKSAGLLKTYDPQFLDTARSLHALKPEEQTLATALRIQVVPVRAGDSFAALAKASNVPQAEARLRLINARYPQGEPVAGEKIKVIR